MNFDKQQKLLFFGALLIILLIYSFAPILIRIGEKELSPVAVIADRLWIATLFILPSQGFHLLRKQSLTKSEFHQSVKSYNLSDFWLSFIAALSSVLCLITWAYSLTQTGVANANLLHNFTPFFVVLGGWLFLKRQVESKFLIGLIIALIGVSCLSLEDFNLSLITLTGDMIALASALFYAINLMATEKLRNKFSTTTVLLWELIFKAVMMLPIVLLLQDQFIPSSLDVWLSVSALGFLAAVVAPWLMFYYINTFSSEAISLFLLSEPLVAAMLAFGIFGEALSLVQWITFPIILGGIYVAQTSLTSPDKYVSELSE